VPENILGNGRFRTTSERHFARADVKIAWRASAQARCCCGKNEISAGTILAEYFSTVKNVMPQGDKSSYTGKQKRQARHIEESYEARGLSVGESERRAWATVNKMTGGGKKSGSGRGKKTNSPPARKGVKSRNSS
jgi:hypothetical protein